MSQTILADTGPLYALADPSDQFHGRAQTELDTIEERGFIVAVNYATLCEAHTLVLRRLGGAYALKWLAEVLAGGVLLNPEPGDYAIAAAQLGQFSDHPITLVDSVTAVVSRRFEVPVWSFDRHFRTMRVKLWR